MTRLELPFPLPVSACFENVPKVVSDTDIIDAYIELGSVKKVGNALGMVPQTVHRRLVKLGANKPANLFTDEDARKVEDYYATTSVDDFDLSVLAKELGRTRQFVCRKAKELGLTSPTRKHSKAQRVLSARPRWEGRQHPRGALGLRHSDEVKKKLSEASRSIWLIQKTFGIGNMSPENLQKKSDLMTKLRAEAPAENTYSRAKRGIREDLGNIFFRSAWEANYARYLNWLIERGEIERWEYEPETFWFLQIKRGVRSYKPDFKVWENGSSYFVEVKGWMDPKSKTKLKRMKKYYPSIRVDVVGAKQYGQIKTAVSRMIAGWES